MKLPVALFLFIPALGVATAAPEIDALLRDLSSDSYEMRQEARFALESAVAQATAPGAEAERQVLEGELVDAMTDATAALPTRVEATRALGLLGTQPAAEALLAAARNPAHPALLRANALKSLKQIPGESVTELLVEALMDADSDARDPWWQALAYRRDRSANAILAGWLEDESPDLPLDALHALGQLGDRELADVLHDAWTEAENGEGKAAAARALLSTEAARERHLRDLLKDGGNPSIAAGAFRQLIERHPGDARDLLGAALREEAGDPVRPLLIQAALASGDEELWDRVVSGLGMLDSRELQVLLGAISDFRKAQYEALVINLALSTEAPEVEVAALACLGDIGGPAAAETLLAALEAADDAVAEAAAEALSRLREPSLDATMLALAGDPADPAHLDAIEILGLRNSPGATALFNDMVRAGASGDTLEALLDALETIGDVRSCRLLMTAVLTTADSGLKRDFQLALKRLTIRLNIGELLWKEVYRPALALAPYPDQKMDVVVLLDGLSNAGALEACLDILEREDEQPELAATALDAMGRWRDLNIGPAWVNMLNDEDLDAARKALALRSLRRLFQAEYVPGNDGSQGRAAGELFLQARQDATRELLLDVAEDKSGWFQGSFYGEIEPYLSLAKYRERIEAMFEE